MFDNIKAWLLGVGAKMGLIKSISNLSEHKKLNIDTEAQERIEKNKGIYKGYYKEWHKVSFKNSYGEEKKRDMKTLNIGKITATKLAKLIFNEKCDIDISSGIDNGKEDIAKEFVLNTLYDNNFYRDFQRYLEYCYALGGVALKVYEHNGLIKLAYATADSFFPISNDSEDIDEALFVTREVKDKKHYTLLEWHEWDENHNYVITNELYEGRGEQDIGHKVPLSILYEDLAEKTVFKNLTKPLFVYIKPNTANNKNLTSPLGVSIYENAYDTLYMLDYLYDFYYHEFRLGKRRVAVNRGMLKPLTNESGKVERVFDSEETVFTPIIIDDNEGIRDLTVGLRVDEIISAIANNLDVLSTQLGLSPGTFSFDGQGLKTATQVISENSATYQTKNSHEQLVEQGIKSLVTAILELAVARGVYSGPIDVEVSVNFDDSIAQDRGEEYDYYSKAVKDNLYPRKRAIMKIFKVTEEEANDILKEIQKESNEAIQEEINLQMDLIGVQQQGAVNQDTNIDKD